MGVGLRWVGMKLMYHIHRMVDQIRTISMQTCMLVGILQAGHSSLLITNANHEL